jgi:hypothetical protein
MNELITKQSVINRLDKAIIDLIPIRNKLWELPEGNPTLDKAMVDLDIGIMGLQKVMAETQQNKDWDGVNHWLSQ